MHMQQASVLFFGKADDDRSDRALAFCRGTFGSVQACLGGHGDAFPEGLEDWRGDYVISYLSRWIIPYWLLQRASQTALNFHPAPPEYPGTGCTNFTLYNDDSVYGVTCHHMAAKVDTGELIAVKRFPLLASDDVASLLTRTHDYLLLLFYEVISELAVGHELPKTDETWTRKPYTRRELDALACIAPDMDAEEIRRRVRATAFGSWRPSVDIAGYRFVLAAE
jgi:methionyl-tRNA formyltransferase